MNGRDDPRSLVSRALGDLASGVPLSAILEQCIRIAELRQDLFNAWWMRREAIGPGGSRAVKALDAQMSQRLAAELYGPLRIALIEDQIERRGMELVDLETMEMEHEVCTISVGEIETQIELLEAHLEASKPPAGLAPLDLYYANQGYHKARAQTQPMIRDLKSILSRIRARLHTFLVQTEAALAVAQTATSTFERTRRFVDGRLGAVAPDALEKLQAAYERADAGHSEALSHALTSCRRVLQSVADVLYPATGTVVIGSDGKSREMTADKYRNRLWQYVSEHASSDTGRRITTATVEELGRKVNILDELSSKGVHGQVTLEEVDQCVLQTYLLVGELLRLAEALPAAPEPA
ncbi:MAG TPA: hypothetical protein VLM76_13165 [Patescibacteria group bacterium]|nr:hypothetical protein [Patescibacteria group bacterium]